MKLFKKTYWLINPILIAFFMLILDKIFLIEEIWINGMIAVSLAYILSPRVTMVDRQNGEEEQIKLLFFNKVINNKVK
ncbi:hypothetical protein [Polaribacter sp. L3A8]|uniref:hypothetical protein n=1 Tax=Polaribacter sp. L3A8 TaxID=2686361 RepID=UPI00131C8BEC|nr:hypothetical protein [Polaribacter sp. L3A8]